MDLSQFWFQSGGGGGYQIGNALRFRGSGINFPATGGWLGQDNPSSGGSTTQWTCSFWTKRGNAGAERMLLSSIYQPNDGEAFSVYFNSSDQLIWGMYFSPIFITTQLFRDYSAWYHIVLVWDSANATAAHRCRLYVNGEEVTTWSTRNDPALNAGNPWCQNGPVPGGSQNLLGYQRGIGVQAWYQSSPYNGYMAEFHCVQGQALDPTDFGEYNDDDVWRPRPFAGTYGTNGFYLDFSDPSNLGADRSGNGNNWTPSGFTTSGTGTDVMSDTPTTNYATFNPLSTRGATATYSEGNLKSVPNQYNQSRTTIPLGSSTGKFYAEATFDNFSSGSFDGEEAFAIQPTSIAQGTVPAHNSGILGIHKAAGTDAFVIKWEGTVVGSAGATQSGVSWTNLTIGLAINFDDQEISGYWNDSLVVGPVDVSTYLDTYDQWIFATTTHGAQPTITFNAGQRDFAYTLPTGFLPLNTANQPAPSIADGSQYFNTVLYTGDGSTDHPITGVGFQPDFVWIKERNDNGSHQLYDAVRGATKRLESDNTTTETTITNGLKSFDTDGFSLGNYSNGNQLNITHASWNWLASNTSGSSNTDGSITSTVSSNLSAGFSIVTYTGDQSSTQTVGHGLGVAPSFIIVKDRDSSSRNWPCYHKDLGLDKVILLNSANAPQSITGYWGSSITSTVFGLPAGGYDNNPTGDKLIAYCWAEVEGYSKFGSYTGNGSTDGTFVYCGFRPAYVINKRTDSTNGWNLWDTTRNPYNTAGIYLQPYSSDSEYNDTTYMGIDMLSNGFKFRNSYSANNGSGSSYIFIAFAENPFGGSNVSPATAR